MEKYSLLKINTHVFFIGCFIFFTLKFMVTSLYIFQRYFDYHYLFWSPLKRTRIDVAVLSMSSTICCQIQTAPSNSNKIHLTSPRFLCFRTLNITLIDMETSVRVEVHHFVLLRCAKVHLNLANLNKSD